ncbi:MAG: Rid family hydrolase, partial [Caulobacteraceae bacterium]
KLDAGPEDVIRTRILLKCIEDWSVVAKAHGETFGAIRPACTFAQIAAFIDPDWLVEIEIEAVSCT